jgi:uncharacterized protein YciI
MKTRSIAVVLLLALAACSSTRSSVAEVTEVAEPGRDYTFVFLVTAEQPAELTEAERKEAFDGHFANMARLAEEGYLLISGPFGPPKADPEHRGMFVFDEASVERAMELAVSDPASQAGIFDMHVLPFRSSSPLTELPRLYEADKARMLALDPDGPEWDMRSYILLSAENGAAAELVLAESSHVLFSGRFGGDMNGHSLFAIDTEAVEGLEGLLGIDLDEASMGWRLHGWYGSVCIAQLPDAG